MLSQACLCGHSSKTKETTKFDGKNKNREFSRQYGRIQENFVCRNQIIVSSRIKYKK